MKKKRICKWCNKYYIPIKKSQECCSQPCSHALRLKRFGHPMKGKKHSMLTRLQMRKAHLGVPMLMTRGKNNHHWKGGISLYVSYKESIKKCELCGSTKYLGVHHKDGNQENNKLNNLIKVCRRCHLTKFHPDVLDALHQHYNRDELGRFKGGK